MENFCVLSKKKCLLIMFPCSFETSVPFLVLLFYRYNGDQSIAARDLVDREVALSSTAGLDLSLHPSSTAILCIKLQQSSKTGRGLMLCLSWTIGRALRLHTFSKADLKMRFCLSSTENLVFRLRLVSL